jgi:hypothetical protein
LKALPQFLQPVENVHPRPADPDMARYVRSFLIMRTLVGLLGIALPFLLVLVDGVWLDGSPFLRESLSAYYYSGARELFVGGLSAIGVFLFTYKVAESNLDNTLSLVAGVMVVVVALCPTSRPTDLIGLTALQNRWGESLVAGIHFTAASLFIFSLAVISYSFGKREGKPQKGGPPQRRSRRFWRTYHWICAALILAALVWSGVTELRDWGPSRSLLYGEVVAVWAFAASWLWKGLEIRTLLGGWDSRFGRWVTRALVGTGRRQAAQDAGSAER